ncbi:hypothetical protein CLF_111843, partial [Clonorchis sinensis]
MEDPGGVSSDIGGAENRVTRSERRNATTELVGIKPARVGGPRKLERSTPIQYLRRSTIAQQYRSELAQQLSTCTGSASVDEAWQNVKEAMLAAFGSVCPTSPIRPQNHWISARSLSMIDARKSIPAGN